MALEDSGLFAPNGKWQFTQSRRALASTSTLGAVGVMAPGMIRMVENGEGLNE